MHSHTRTRVPTPANYRRSIRTGGEEKTAEELPGFVHDRGEAEADALLKIEFFSIFCQAWATSRSLGRPARPKTPGPPLLYFHMFLA